MVETEAFFAVEVNLIEMNRSAKEALLFSSDPTYDAFPMEHMPTVKLKRNPYSRQTAHISFSFKFYSFRTHFVPSGIYRFDADSPSICFYIYFYEHYPSIIFEYNIGHL